MPHVPIPNTAKVCLRFTRKGQTVCNTFHVEWPTAPTAAMMEDLAEDIKGWWDTVGKATASTDTSLQVIEMRSQHAHGAPGIDYAVGLPIAGTRLTDSLPNNVTVASKLTTGLAGRSYRGRWFWNGMTRDQILAASDTIPAAVQTQLTNALTTLVGVVVSAGAEFVIASLWEAGVQRVTGVTTPVTGVSTNITADSQRRRLPERGA